ncbi:MAG: phosphopyruvate hydratase [Clostridia bacterium]|nr:phosphopyruvate hydratase [Clostridia bacterium]
MKHTYEIKEILPRMILDSRGNPTTEAEVELSDGSVGIASCPSGASTGAHEALELRDNDKAFYGKGVQNAITSMRKLTKHLCGERELDQARVDLLLMRLDGTENKSKLGANSLLPISLACARAHANQLEIPLYRYLGGIHVHRLPIPMMNILNGGAHAANSLDFQEFMIVPAGFSTYGEALQAGCEIYATLKRILQNEGHHTGVGDEGGFAPDLTDEEEALQLIVSAIEEAGYDVKRVKIALDVAASEWFEDGRYRMPKSGRVWSAKELIAHLERLCDRYPILSIEDGLAEDDLDGWRLLTETLGHRVHLVGDDLFVTNPSRLKLGIDRDLGNAILIKPNQIGTLSEVFRVISLARAHGYSCILSHRSGETEDTFLADLAVASEARYIKCGAPCRSERVCKYNRLTQIAEELVSAVYGE